MNSLHSEKAAPRLVLTFSMVAKFDGWMKNDADKVVKGSYKICREEGEIEEQC